MFYTMITGNGTFKYINKSNTLDELAIKHENTRTEVNGVFYLRGIVQGKEFSANGLVYKQCYID